MANNRLLDKYENDPFIGSYYLDRSYVSQANELPNSTYNAILQTYMHKLPSWIQSSNLDMTMEYNDRIQQYVVTITYSLAGTVHGQSCGIERNIIENVYIDVLTASLDQLFTEFSERLTREMNYILNDQHRG